MKAVLIAITLAVLISSIGSASAYPIPVQYRPQVTNDISAYALAEEHYSESWAKDTLRQLAQDYTNNGRLDQLIIKMEYLMDHEVRNKV